MVDLRDDLAGAHLLFNEVQRVMGWDDNQIDPFTPSSKRHKRGSSSVPCNDQVILCGCPHAKNST